VVVCGVRCVVPCAVCVLFGLGGVSVFGVLRCVCWSVSVCDGVIGLCVCEMGVVVMCDVVFVWLVICG
jgi:hypothetical protein